MRTFLGQNFAVRSSESVSEAYDLRLKKALPWMMGALFEHGHELVASLLSYTALEGLFQGEEVDGMVISRDELQPLRPGTGELPTRPLRDRSRQLATQADEADLVSAAIFDQMPLFLQTVAERYPLILVFDNLQWVDVHSADLFNHLCRRLSGSRILIVAAFRPEEIARVNEKPRHPLETMINELKSVYGDIDIDLDCCDGKEFVEALLDQEPNRFDADFRHTLYRSTAGHPLLVVELLRSLKEGKALIQAQDGAWTTGPDLDWDHLPPRIEGFVTERIHRAPPELHELLEAASVQGETFIAEVVAAILGESEGDVIHLLSGASSPGHNLLIPQGVRELGGRNLSMYQFRNLIYQKYLYGSLDAVKRTRLHQKTLETMAGLYNRVER